MKIKLVNSYFFSIPFNRRISNLNINLSRHVILKITDGRKEGLGEGVLYKSTTINAARFLKNEVLSYLEKNEFKNIKDAKNKINNKYAHKNSGVVCALDLALWDLESKVTNKSIVELLGGKLKSTEITEELFKDEFNKLNINKINRNGTKSLKIKIGKELLKDFKYINLLKNYFNGHIRVDANQIYTFKQYKLISSLLSKIGIWEFEEPVSKSDLSKLDHKENIVLDESYEAISDLKKYLKIGFQIFNVKIAKAGGISGALRFIKIIEKSNARIILGSNEELGIASFSMFSLANSIRNLHSIEGLGSERLGFDVIKNRIKINGGKIIFPINIEFSEKRLILASRKFNFKILKDEKLSLDFLIFEIYQDILGKIKNLWIRIKIIFYE